MDLTPPRILPRGYGTRDIIDRSADKADAANAAAYHRIRLVIRALARAGVRAAIRRYRAKGAG